MSERERCRFCDRPMGNERDLGFVYAKYGRGISRGAGDWCWRNVGIRCRSALGYEGFLRALNIRGFRSRREKRRGDPKRYAPGF